MSSLALGVYRLAAAALAPLAARRLARDGADPARQGERHGRVPERRGELWLHAASVGELNAAEPLLRALLARVPEARIVVSTLTATGAAECARRFSGKDRLRHLYAPLDSRRRVVRWLDATRPARLLLVETELWPELLHQCHARSIPVALVNARLSDRAFPRYLRMRRLITPVLRQVHPVLCQTDDDARRYIALGASADSVHVCGNLKLDRDALPEPSARVREWMAPAQQRPIWVAGSTHPGEEELLAKAHMDLIAKLPDALLICVPRHPNRSAETLNIMRSAGLNAGLIDQFPEQPALSAVVVDQLGVLTELYQLADCCFVGGSLVPGIGGHNLFEPALAGRPVVSGPWTESQREIATAMMKANALQEVHSADGLAQTITCLL
ncbi:MAG: 3-deoxy-D-manno-octulosonic acid transferase, partial [Wenzhouxiangellaceae bacterium]